MRIVTGLLVAGAAVLGAPGTAAASVLPPVDLARGQLGVTAGLPHMGVDASLGRLVLGASASAVALPLVGAGYGFAARAAWRLSGLPGRELCLGLGLLGGGASIVALSGATSGNVWEGWFLQPGLVMAWPITSGVTLRAMAGPVFFTQVVGRTTALGGGTGVIPVFPNAELAIRLAPGHELTIGGLPSLIGWRGFL